jgi:energy-coupling factor transport system substrate-specific component
MFKRFSTRDLIVISTLAAIGIAIKPLVGPLFKMISPPLAIPGGSLAGGFYMLWLSLAVFMVGKTGTGTFLEWCRPSSSWWQACRAIREH